MLACMSVCPMHLSLSRSLFNNLLCSIVHVISLTLFHVICCMLMQIYPNNAGRYNINNNAGRYNIEVRERERERVYLCSISGYSGLLFVFYCTCYISRSLSCYIFICVMLMQIYPNNAGRYNINNNAGRYNIEVRERERERESYNYIFVFHLWLQWIVICVMLYMAPSPFDQCVYEKKGGRHCYLCMHLCSLLFTCKCVSSPSPLFIFLFAACKAELPPTL